MQSGMLGTWGVVGAYVAGQLPFGQDPSASDRHIWQICAYVMAALTGILLIFILVLIRRIKVNCPSLLERLVLQCGHRSVWPLMCKRWPLMCKRRQRQKLFIQLWMLQCYRVVLISLSDAPENVPDTPRIFRHAY